MEKICIIMEAEAGTMGAIRWAMERRRTQMDLKI